MSKLTHFLEHAHHSQAEYLLSTVADKITEMLRSHDAEIREQAMLEQMEADIALISGIELGSYTIPEEVRLDLTNRNLEVLVAIMERGWVGYEEFAVAQLRAAYAKSEQKRKGGAA